MAQYQAAIQAPNCCFKGKTDVLVVLDFSRNACILLFISHTFLGMAMRVLQVIPLILFRILCNINIVTFEEKGRVLLRK